ncbi:hypothetical protein [Rubrivivax gelatinosus]|nr:hypothetical protein [Rubrivivax gelatinosus]
MPEPRQPPPPWEAAPELRVVQPAAVEVLWHPAKRLHLRPFLGRAAGLAEAAALLGIRKPAMSYWVGRLTALGLIRPWALERRGRQRVLLYRCVADRLLVGLGDAPHASYEGVFDDAERRWQPDARAALGRSLARQAPWLALAISVGGPGGLQTELTAQAPGAPADDFLFCWGRLWLDAGEREQLRAELDALWDRWAARSDQIGKRCPTLLHLVTVPERR